MLRSSLLVVLAAVLAACGGGTVRGASPSDAPPGSGAALENQVLAESVDFGPFGPLLDAAARAKQGAQPRSEAEVQSCMGSHGFRYQIEPQPNLPTPANPYALVTTSEIATGSYTTSIAPLPRDRNAAYLSSLTASETQAWTAALTGAGEKHVTVDLPSGSWYAFAPSACSVVGTTTALGPTFMRAYLNVQDQARLVLASTLADTSSKNVISAWARCVTTHGVGPVTTLGGLQDRAVRLHLSRQKQARLLAIDRNCEESAGVRKVLGAVQLRYQRAAVASDYGPFQQLTAALTRLGYSW